MLGRVSSSVRVDSAQQRLTPSLEAECASICFSSVLFWFAGHMSTSAELLGRKKMDRRPDPGNQSGQGLQAQGSNRGETRLPGAADPDKSFILCHAFRNRTGACETSFLSLGCRAPLFPIPKDYFMGPDLVVAAAARR